MSVASTGDSHLTELLASLGHSNVTSKGPKVESYTSSLSLESTDSLLKKSSSSSLPPEETRSSSLTTAAGNGHRIEYEFGCGFSSIE